MKLTLKSFCLFLPLIIALPAAAQTSEPMSVKLVINGRAVEAEAPALINNGFLLISSSVLSSELGLVMEAGQNGLWVVRACGQQFALRPDNLTYQLNNKTLQATVAPCFRGSELYVPLQILVKPLNLTVNHPGAWEITTPATSVVSIRQGVHPDKVRFVVDLSAPALYRWYEEPGKLVVEFPALPDSQGRTNLVKMHQFDDRLADQVTVSTNEGRTRLIVAHKSTQPPALFTLEGPPRIVLDLFRAPVAAAPSPAEAPRKPRSGDIWESRVFTGAKGPVQAYVLRFNPRKTGWQLRPALGGETIMKRARVSTICSRNSAYAAINGGFFSSLGPPLGMLVIDGEWIKAPLYNRTVLGITADGRYAIANTDFDGRVEFEGFGFLPLEGINQGHVANDSIEIYTQRWGPVLLGATGQTRLVVGADGQVKRLSTAGEDLEIPSGGYILSGNGRREQTLAKIPVGTKVTLKLSTTPHWPDLQHAIGGGPLLVQEGKVLVNARAERFRADVTNGSHPRSAVGIAANGDLILIAVQKPGMTLNELAQTMVKLGAQTAMNLDGGGSTAIVVDGKLLNQPADGSERAVSNAILIVKG